MEHTSAAPEQPEQEAPSTVDEQRAREREALRRRVRQSLVLCPDAQISPRS
jgi:hypothetical protein